ncbi:MAG: heavy metal-associated domain-containing protein [Pedobacter sp.]
MHTLKFKTDIKCQACIDKVTPILNELNNVAKWEVDTTHPDKVLSIETDAALNPKEVIMQLDKVGYQAIKI